MRDPLQSTKIFDGGALTPSLIRRYGASLLVLLGGLSATFALFSLQRATEYKEAEQRFTQWTEERYATLQKIIDSHLETLYGVRALFDSSEFVSEAEFQRFTADSVSRHQYIRAIDWLPRKTPAQAASDAPATQRFELRYSRRAGASPTNGTDLQLPSVVAALDRARITRRPAAVVGYGERALTYIYLPVYHLASSAPTVEPMALDGYVRIAFSVDDLMQPTLREAQRDGIEVTLPEYAATAPTLASNELARNGYLHIADQAHLLRFLALPHYVGAPRVRGIWILVGVGVFTTILGAGAALLLTRNRLHLQMLARELTEENAERRRSEERLSQSEARYRILVENSPDAVLLNRAQRVAFVNRAGLALLGASGEEEIVGKSIFEIVHPDCHEQQRARLRVLETERRILPPVELRYVRVDGTTVDVEVLTVPFIADGELTLQTTARDITQRRQAERERATLEAALRQAQKLEAIGTLAGGIAHDFNNIISAIVGNTRLLSEDLPQDHPASHSVREIRNATNRARDLVKRIMTFSRQQEAQRTAVPLAPLIGEVQQLMRATLPAGVELLARVPPNTPAVLADATQVHQVLVNLCTNAWQAMRGSTGRIEINVSTLTADVASTRANAPLHKAMQYVCIAVHDNGSGIAPEALEHIFEPFFTTKAPGEGTGLGLAVVHGIVQSHEGAITVSSRSGEGTSFQVYLPACDATPLAAAEAQNRGARGENQHVLYIDDEEPLIFLVTRTLTRQGYRCTGQSDARRGIAALRADPGAFDLVITDLNMPGMSGLDVAREVRAIRADLPVVITTGYVRSTDVALGRSLGVRDVILKPDTIDELALIVQRYLREARANQSS